LKLNARVGVLNKLRPFLFRWAKAWRYLMRTPVGLRFFLRIFPVCAESFLSDVVRRIFLRASNKKRQEQP